MDERFAQGPTRYGTPEGGVSVIHPFTVVRWVGYTSISTALWEPTDQRHLRITVGDWVTDASASAPCAQRVICRSTVVARSSRALNKHTPMSSRDRRERPSDGDGSPGA